MLRPYLLVVLGSALTACGQTSIGESGPLPETSIVVDPAEFMEGVPCGTDPGSLQVYVATLTDVLALPGQAPQDAAPLVLPSSEKTLCHRAVHFLRVAPGREYVADIDGYDRDDITPLAPGSRIQVDADGRYVEPRWTTSCGREALRVPGANDAGIADATSDAGIADALDAGGTDRPADASTSGALPPGTDAATACRPRPHDPPDGGRPRSPWPACALEFETVTVRGCAPLRERTASDDDP